MVLPYGWEKNEVLPLLCNDWCYSMVEKSMRFYFHYIINGATAWLRKEQGFAVDKWRGPTNGWAKSRVLLFDKWCYSMIEKRTILLWLFAEWYCTVQLKKRTKTISCYNVRSTYSSLSIPVLLLPLPMVWTSVMGRRTSWCLTWAVEPLMCLFSPSTTVFLRWWPLMETLTWVSWFLSLAIWSSVVEMQCELVVLWICSCEIKLLYKQMPLLCLSDLFACWTVWCSFLVVYEMHSANNLRFCTEL